MKKLLLWDIDGTIIVSKGAGIRAMEGAFRQCFGLPGDLSRIQWAGRTDRWISGEILRQNNLPATPDNIHGILEAYLSLLPGELASGPHGQVLPGVLPLLDMLHRHPGVVQGLLTGNLQRGAQFKLSHYKVWHYFEFGAFADDSPLRNELGPHALRRASLLHGTPFTPDQTYVIGDTPHDIACGKAIGAHTIAVATGGTSIAELQAHVPDAALPDLSDQAAFLRSIGL